MMMRRIGSALVIPTVAARNGGAAFWNSVDILRERQGNLRAVTEEEYAIGRPAGLWRARQLAQGKPVKRSMAVIPGPAAEPEPIPQPSYHPIRKPAATTQTSNPQVTAGTLAAAPAAKKAEAAH